MEPIKVSKNLYKGELITDFTQLMVLADQKKSVCFHQGWESIWVIRPASFIINWPLAMLVRMRLYTTKRIEE